MNMSLLFLATLASVFHQGIFQQFQSGQTLESCPERNGRFADPAQCDAYIECLDGIASHKLCPDGLLFNTKSPFYSYPCLYPQEVECEGRSIIQPAQPTGQCPHKFGYFRLGDENNCGQFLNCANGRGYVFDCPEGLAFNEQSLKCDWADQVPSCNAEAYLGFSCPNIESPNFGPSGYVYYRSPVTCEKYYICINGRPRLFSCGSGNAFNEITNECDAPENVTGCASFAPSGPRPQQINQGFSNQPQSSFF